MTPILPAPSRAHPPYSPQSPNTARHRPRRRLPHISRPSPPPPAPAPAPALLTVLLLRTSANSPFRDTLARVTQFGRRPTFPSARNKRVEQQRDELRQKISFRRDLSGIRSAFRFRQRLNFPALVAEILKGMSRTTAHFFAVPSDCIFAVADGDSFDTSFIEVPKTGSRREKSRKSAISSPRRNPL